MKKIFLLFGIIAMASCTSEDISSPTGPDADDLLVLTAGFEGTPSDANRTTLNPADGTGTQVYFNRTDEVSVFEWVGEPIGDGGKKYEAASRWTAEGDVAPTAKFAAEAKYNPAATYYVLYPYQSDASISKAADESIAITATVPAHQTAIEGTYDAQANISLAKANGYEFILKNLCTVVKFTVPDGEYYYNKAVISNTGEGTTPMAGKATIKVEGANGPEVTSVTDSSNEIVLEKEDKSNFVTGKTYYIALLPGTYTKGITLRLYANKTSDDSGHDYIQKHNEKSTTFARKKIINMGDFENTKEEHLYVVLCEVGEKGSGDSLCVAVNNVGTKTPFERGIYVAWGELTGHQNKDGSYNPDLYNWTNYKWCKGNNGKALTKYCFNKSYWDSGSGEMDMKTELDDEDDLARQAWGEPWRMMTYEEAYCLAPNDGGVDPNRNGLGRVRWVEGNTVDGHVYVTKWNRIAPDGTVDEDRFVWLPPTQLSDITGTEYSYYWTKTIQSGLHDRAANPSYAMQIASASTTGQHWNSGVMQRDRYFYSAIRPVFVLKHDGTVY